MQYISPVYLGLYYASMNENPADDTSGLNVQNYTQLILQWHSSAARANVNVSQSIYTYIMYRLPDATTPYIWRLAAGICMSSGNNYGVTGGATLGGGVNLNLFPGMERIFFKNITAGEDRYVDIWGIRNIEKFHAQNKTKGFT